MFDHGANALPRLWDEAVEARVRSVGMVSDKQMSELPKDVKFCKRCVVSNQRPRIIFDEEGICSACRYAEQKAQTDWPARDGELKALLAKHRKSSGYDVIVPCSGGKDSSTVAHRLKHEYGMTPLCVKWAPFAYTEIGFKNFQNFVQSGFDTMVMWPNGLIHRKLARLAFEFLGDAWQPFAYGQLNYALHIASKFDVPLVFFGENGEAEYGGSTKANNKPCFDFEDWDEVYLKGAAVDRLLELGKELGVFTDLEAREVSQFYRLPERNDLGQVQFHWFSYYRKWHPQGNYYYACENTGFQANTERSEGTYSKYASLDDQLDGFHYYFAHLKFGIGRCTSDAAHEIRDGEINRDEGVQLVHRYDGEFPARYFNEFLSYLDIDQEHFWMTAERYRNPNLWTKVDWDLDAMGNTIGPKQPWQLKHRVSA